MRKILSLWALFLCATACIYPYTPELDEAPEGVLAVDANISIGDVSSVRVSTLRSVWPSDNAFYPDLSGVQVWVEDETGVTYPGVPDPAYFGYYDFIIPGNALYTIATENAPADRRYRLCIKTPDAQYASDWSDIAAPPVIKKIDFTADDVTVSVNVSVDGGAAATGYFLLSYDETWEFHADYVPRFAVTVRGSRVSIEETYPDYSRYWCWKSSNNNQIYPVDYTAMSESGVTSWPLTRFSRRDDRNHKRYCVTVKARTVSKETYRFLKERIRPAYLHVFPYSRRPGTRAATMPDQVQDSLKTERVARLEALCEQLHAAFVASHKGMEETVLWESSVKNGLMGGYTGNYIRVEKPYDPALVNQLEKVIL